MKINSIKLTLVFILAAMISTLMVGLFFIEMPQGNRDIANIAVGSLFAVFTMVIADLIKKGA